MSQTETEEETGSLFPELDQDNAKHVAVLKAARAYAKAKQQRSEVLSTAKEKEDGAMGKLLAAMHEAGLVKFKHGGVRGEIIPSKEKCQVRIEDEDDDAGGEND